MTDYVVALRNSATPVVQMTSVNPPGPKGDPGGNIMAIGLFADAATLTIGSGTDVVRTSGYAVPGKGIADYVYDAAVDAAYVTANPRTSFRSANSRGFRLVGPIFTAHMFGALGDAGVDGSGGTDDTAAIQAAINFLDARDGGTLFFPHGSYKCASTISLNSMENITLVGVSGTGAGYNAPPPSQLIYTGTGSTPFLSARSTYAVAFREMGIRYTSGSFTGDLIDYSHDSGAYDSSYGLIERCLLYGINVTSCRRLVNLSLAILCSVVDSHLGWGQVGIGGRIEVNVGNVGYSNAHLIERCTFDNLAISALTNAGEGWTVIGNWFEGTNGGMGGMPRAYWDDISAASEAITVGLAWLGNWHGDAVTVSGAWFSNNHTTIRGLTICGGDFDTQFTSAPGIKLSTACKGVSIQGVYLTHNIDLGNAVHSGLVITGNFMGLDVANVTTSAVAELMIMGNITFGGPAKTTLRVLKPDALTMGHVDYGFGKLYGLEAVGINSGNGRIRFGFDTLGFYGTAPVEKPTVVGTPTAGFETSLRDALVALGLINWAA